MNSMPPGTASWPTCAGTWEAATAEAAAAGVRVAIVRLGVVLTPDGGALGKMLTPFRARSRGKEIGSGRQFMPWISLVDTVRAISWVLGNESARGPINLVAPIPVSNAAFTNALGKALRRPTFMTIPAPLISALFGQMGRETLLSSCRVEPQRLVAGGFQFEQQVDRSGSGGTADVISFALGDN